MPQIINTNIMSMNSQRNLNKSQSAMATSLQRLSSGLRINSAKDDAAGLAITERFTAQIRGLSQAQRNANDGISLAQVAEGALAEVSNMMQRMRELAVQSVNDTNSSTDRQALNSEVSQLMGEINRIANSTEFNGRRVLDGSLSEFSFQVGAYKGQTIEVAGVDSRAQTLGYTSKTGTSLTSANVASAATANDLTINGFAVDLTGATTNQDVVDAINNITSTTDLTAQLAREVERVVTYAATAGVQTVVVNGVDINISSSATITQAAAIIDGQSNVTGVSARVSGGSLVLSNSTGSQVDADLSTVGGSSSSYYAGIEILGAPGSTITVAGTADTSLGGINAATAESERLSGSSVVTKSDAETALKTIDQALQQISSKRAELGAVQNRFQSTIANLSTSVENLSASRSRIQDADFAVETAELTRTQILQQAGVAMLAQANSLPQNVLSLLQ